MVISTNRSKRVGSSASASVTLLGAALILTTVLTCLAYAGMREGAALSLRDLESDESTLMSCAHDDAPLSGAELLWCADPSSPLCLPAQPASGHIELADTPPVAFWDLAVAVPEAVSWVLPGWERPAPVARPRTLDSSRLERPPRA